MEKQSNSLDSLRAILLALPPAGEAGFEGLSATLIAKITGLQIRLAKSGLQFGRDGSSPAGPFSLAVEAKRYEAPLRLEDLSGKAALASFALGQDTDLWVVVATSEIGDDAIRKLPKLAEEQGMSVVFLDWGLRPIPPLAVLLASEPEETESWFTRFQPTVDPKKLKRALKAIRNDASFLESRSALLSSLSSAEVGLGSLRKAIGSWLHERWADSSRSRREFGQIITPLEPGKHTLSGRASRLNLNAEIEIKGRPNVVAILGDEGTGKTWLVPDWWLGLSERPLLLPAIGKTLETLDATDPVGSIARLFERFFPVSQISPEGWRRRIDRWSKRKDSQKPWLVVYIDGLNERPDLPWGDLVSAFGDELSKIGGSLLISCRPSFWQREVVPRLQNKLTFSTLALGGFTADDVKTILIARGIDPETLSQRVRKFLQNPRICTVALDLLMELAAAPGELTTERLQIEYWKHRLKERGNLVQHDLGAFFATIKGHVEELGSDPQHRFSLHDWFEKSPLGKRGITAVEKDTSDIVEGLFMKASDADASMYEFRPEALAFALGLRIAHNLRDFRSQERSAFAEAIDSMIEPVLSFGFTSQIICAAFVVACVDGNYPIDGRRALLQTWARLQNLDEDALEAMSSNVLLSPEVFCDVLEELHDSDDYHPGENQLEKFLFEHASDQRVDTVLSGRMPGWMNRWSKMERPFPGVKKTEESQDSANKELALLRVDERREMDSVCVETDVSKEVRTDELAAVQLLSGPQTKFAANIWAWCLAQTIVQDYSAPQEDMQWALRLNASDWKETAATVRELLRDVNGQNSEPYRRAAARCLRLTGGLVEEGIAESLIGPLLPGTAWRRVEAFCNTNPHDPTALLCDNLNRALETLANIPVHEMRLGRFSNLEDNNFSTIQPALARFSPEPLIETIRKFAATAEVRDGMALLALSWELDEYSPVLDEATVKALERALLRFATESVDWSSGDNQLLVNRMLFAIFTHTSAERQLELLLMLPSGVRLFENLIPAIKRASAKQLEAAFAQAARSGSSSGAERVLIVASASAIKMNPSLRAQVRQQILEGTQAAKNLSFDVIRRSADKELDVEIIEQTKTSPIADPSDADFHRSEALAQAVSRSGDATHLELLPLGLRQPVAAQMADDAIDAVADDFDKALHTLMESAPEISSSDSLVLVETTADGMMQRIDVTPGNAPELQGILAQDAEESAKRFERSQQRRIEEHRRITKQQVEDGLELSHAIPSSRYLRRLVERTPATVANWLSSILEVQDPSRLLLLFNQGAALSAAFAKVDGTLTAKVLEHLASWQSSHRVVSGDTQVPLYLQAIFADSLSDEMAQLRQTKVEAATNDAELELYARAASVYGTHDWLKKYIRTSCSEEHPGVQARGLTLAGFSFPQDDYANLLAEERKSGFLGQVTKFARKQRQRAQWAEHWCNAALGAGNGIDFWRFGKLAEGVVDLRFGRSFVHQIRQRTYIPNETELYKRLKKAAESRARDRQKTLFGLKVPSDRLIWAITHSRPQASRSDIENISSEA